MNLCQSKSDFLSLCINVHRNISSANAFLKINSVNSATVKVNCDNLTISFLKNGAVDRETVLVVSPIVFIPTSFAFLNETKSDLCCNEKENYVKFTLFKPIESSDLQASFRLQLHCDKIETTSHTCMSFNDLSIADIEPNASYKLHCTSCKTALADDCVSFEAVKEYHDSSSEMSDSFFCHNHDGEKPCAMPKPTAVLYISDTCYIMTNMFSMSLKIANVGGLYKCISCDSVLAVTSTIAETFRLVHFFMDKIEFVKPEQSPCLIDSSVALKILRSLIRTSLHDSVTCKLYLETKVDSETKMCLLLWVMKQTVEQLILQKEASSLQPEEILTGKEVFKVLYLSTEHTSQIANSWRHSFAVDYHVISDSMFKTVNALLAKSSQLISESLSTMDGFSIGFIDCS